ncbi:hypothetical protein WME94_33560 [Sorangium sp. So ce429]
MKVKTASSGGNEITLTCFCRIDFARGNALRLQQRRICVVRYHNVVFRMLKATTRLDDEELAELRAPAASPLVYGFPPSARAP